MIAFFYQPLQVRIERGAGVWYNYPMKAIMGNNWIKAIIINIVILAVALIVADTVYETNDDYVISLRMVDGYAYSTFVNWFLCKGIIALQSVIPGVNAFVVAQMVISWVSFLLITRTILESIENKTLLVIAVLILTVFAGDHYCIIQFTKTSAVALTAGFLVLIDAMIRKRSVGMYVWAFVLIYLGTWMRTMNLIAAIGFAGLFLIAWVIIHRKELIPEGYLKGRRIALYVVCLALVAGAAGTYVMSMSINNSTQELKDFNEYDTYRSLVTDYPVYENYENGSMDYEMAGISKNDLYLINSWYLDYDGAASLENLKTINEIYNETGQSQISVSEAVQSFKAGTVKDLSDFDRRGVHLLILGLLGAAVILLYRPRYWVYVIATGALVAALYIYLYYVGRPLYRATYIADISAMTWILYFMGGEEVRKGVANIRAGAIKVMICVLCAAFVLVCQMPMKDAYTQLHDYAVKGRISDEMTSYLKEHEDSFYVFGTGTRGLSPYYSEPLTMPGPNYQKNALGFGSWGTGSPYLKSKLAQYGLNNTFGDLIDNEKAFVFEDKNVDRLTKYFNKWYGPQTKMIYLEHVDTVAGHDLWKVVRH